MVLTNRANSSDKSLMMAVSCETNLHALEPILHAHVMCNIGAALSTGSVVVFEEMKTSNDSFVIKVLNPIQCSYPIFLQKTVLLVNRASILHLFEVAILKRYSILFSNMISTFLSLTET